jgi:hypothetical protein
MAIATVIRIAICIGSVGAIRIASIVLRESLALSHSKQPL